MLSEPHQCQVHATSKTEICPAEYNTLVTFLLLEVVSDLRGRVVVGRDGGGGGCVDGAPGQEVEDDEAVLVRHQPVQVRLPDPV